MIDNSKFVRFIGCSVQCLIGGLVVEEFSDDLLMRSLRYLSMTQTRLIRGRKSSTRDMVLGALATNLGRLCAGEDVEGLTQRQIAEIIGVTAQSMGETLAELEREDMVVRSRSQKDRRKIVVGITDLGYENAKLDLLEREQLAKETFAALTPREKVTLLRIVMKLNASLGYQVFQSMDSASRTSPV
jgi:DNA-binding MarR family transcriptional regulator